MIPFLTLEQVKSDLGILDSDRDEQVEMKADMAADIVLGYIKKTAEEMEWDAETVPFRIKAAVLLVTRSLFFEDAADPISDPVRRLLHRDRDPALA